MSGGPAEDVQAGHVGRQGQKTIVLDKDHALLTDLLDHGAGAFHDLFGDFNLGGVHHAGEDALHGAVADHVDDQDDHQQEGQDRRPADHMAGALLGQPVGRDEDHDQRGDGNQDGGDMRSALLQIGLHLAGFGAHLVEDRTHERQQTVHQLAALFSGLGLFGLGFGPFGLGRPGLVVGHSVGVVLSRTGVGGLRSRAALGSRRLGSGLGRLGLGLRCLSLMELDADGLGQRIDLVGLGAGVVDNARPVQAEAEVIGVAVGVLVALAVPGQVLLLLLDLFHGDGLLVVQQAVGLHLAGEDVQQGLGKEPVAVETGAAVAEKDDVGQRLDLAPDHGTAGLHQDDDLAALGHSLRDVLEHLQIGVVGGAAHGLAGVGAVDLDRLGHHTVTVVLGDGLGVGGYGLTAGLGGGVLLILDGGGQVGILAQIGVRAVDGAIGSWRGHGHQGQVAGSQLRFRGADDVVLGVGGLAVLVGIAAGLAHGIGDHIVVLGDLVQIHGGVPASVGGGAAGGHIIGRAGAEDVGHVDRQHRGVFPGLMDDVAAVLQHDDALLLHSQGEGVGLVVVDGGVGLVQLHIGVVEQAALELGQQEVIAGVAQDLQGLIVAQLVLHQLKALGSGVQVGGATHLVDAVDIELGKTLGLGQVLHAEGLGAVGGDAPVGEDEALVVVLAEQADLVLGVGAAHQLAQSVVAGGGDGVVGHDAGLVGDAPGQVEGAVKEGDQVGGKVVRLLEDVELAAVAVVVAAALGGSGAGVVLGDGVDGILAPAKVFAVLRPGALQAGDVGVSQVAAQGRVLGVGAGGAGQVRGGADVNLGSQQHGDADGAVHLSVGHSQRKGNVRIEGGAKSQLVDGVGDVAGVDGNGGGDAPVAVGLTEGLQGVGPFHGHASVAGVGSAAGHAAAATALDVLQVFPVDLGAEGSPAAVGEERGHLVHAQAIGQIPGAGLIVQPPVLIGLQLTVPVQILEGVAVRLDQLHAGVGRVAQGLTSLVGDLDPAVVSLFLVPLVAVGESGDGQSQKHRRGQKQCEQLFQFPHAVFSFPVPGFPSFHAVIISG